MHTRPFRGARSARSQIKLILVEFLRHHNLIIITQAGDGNLLHVIFEFNREHALVFLLVQGFIAFEIKDIYMYYNESN